MTRTLERLPAYLRQYCTEQVYETYTPRDQAAWRYIMRQNVAFFERTAVSVYLQGLRATGISLDRIPRIEEMDEALGQFGWGAVAVCGFIPPAAFLDFQARQVLAIAVDMRTVEHIGYTPAPDIVHEAAGHAPIVVEPDYRDYLQRYAAMAQKAIMSKEDIDVYEAIRYLSDIKENPQTSQEEIDAAYARLSAAQESVSHVSEATQLARMAWWTVEYGLVGPMEKPRVYGAGLLSSVDESQQCLSSAIKKIPLSVACVDQSYDITKPQPQLFVAPNLPFLTEVLEQFQETMAFKLGGVEGLEKGRLAKSVITLVTDAGLQLSGCIDSYETSEGEVSWVSLAGPLQWARDGEEITMDRTGEALGFPTGRWRAIPDQPPHLLSDEQLRAAGVTVGNKACLELNQGFVVEGEITRVHRPTSGELEAISWRDVTVRRGSQTYLHHQDWVWPVTAGIQSVYGGPADRDRFEDWHVGQATTKPGGDAPKGDGDSPLMKQYARLRKLRESDQPAQRKLDELQKMAIHLLEHTPEEWLLALELLEVASQLGTQESVPWRDGLSDALVNGAFEPQIRTAIDRGLKLIDQPPLD